MIYWGKKGSHVGVMISFNLFILFLLSIFLIISPALRGREYKQPVLDALEEKILENVSIESNLFLIEIAEGYDSGGKGCIEVPEGGGLEFSSGAVVKDVFGERIASSLGESFLRIAWTGDNRFFKIYSSPGEFDSFSPGLSDCDFLEGGDFSIKFVKLEKYPFEPNILKLSEAYDSSYEGLKEELGLSIEDEFGFSFTNSRGGVSSESGIPPMSKDIYSKEIPIIYADSNSTLLVGTMRLKVW